MVGSAVMKTYYGETDEKDESDSSLPLIINSCGVDNQWFTYRVWRKSGRSDWLLMYVVSGVKHIEFKGKHYDLNAGDFILIPPRTPQCYWHDGDCISYYIHFSGYFAEMLLKQLNIQPQVYFSAPFKRIADSFERLIDECYIPNSPIVPTLFVSILTQLFEKYYSNSVSNSARIKKAINYIAENYNKPLDTSYCAELCRMSQSYFLHIFKSVMGMSPHAYQTQKRISHAKFLLKYSSLSIEKISNEIGITNQFYFSKVFKRKIGCSPYDFRKQYREAAKEESSAPK